MAVVIAITRANTTGHSYCYSGTTRDSAIGTVVPCDWGYAIPWILDDRPSLELD
jgi:hypothetical protein